MSKRVAMAKMKRISAAMDAGAQLEVAAAWVQGVGFRVLWGAGGTYVSMSPAAARRLAAGYETPKSVDAGLEDIGANLRVAADVAEAGGATRQ